MKMNLLILDARDTVAVALEPLPRGALCSFGSGGVMAAESIPFAHKIALRSISRGSPVIKYGESIGVALCDITEGDWVHTHNVSTTL